MKPGDLARLDTSVYWYHEMRTDNLSDRTFLLLDFYAKPTGTVYSADDTADGMTVDRGSRIGIATLLIDVGCLDAPTVTPDIPRAEVLAALGEDS